MPLLYVVPRPEPAPVDPVEAARERLTIARRLLSGALTLRVLSSARARRRLRAAWRLYHQARRDLRALGGL